MMDDDKAATLHEPDKTRQDQPVPAVAPQQQPIEPAPQKEADQDSDDRFNFGGLPNRNLKKNLGCGG